MDIKTEQLDLTGLDSLNVILGKNGCGKSYVLKKVEEATRGNEHYGRVGYISPERGGFLKLDTSVEQAIVNDTNWMPSARRRNQAENFKQQSTILFRQLEILTLREIERDQMQPGHVPRNFDTTVDLLNGLLDRVRLERDAKQAFRIVEKDSGDDARPEDISSGEAELISLGIEFLTFVKDAQAEKTNLLLVDEPDVHLHPDLQDRLAQFLVEILTDKPVTLVLATHSTALLAGLANKSPVRVAFMRYKDKTLDFRSVSEVDRRILPIFGAHPLSNVFNQAPVLLVEGEDDERIWQQAVRSGAGLIRVYPCVVDGIDHLAEYEVEVNNVIEAVYDNARAFSLRDRDLQPEEINDVGHVIRTRLSCRAAENLMLSDEVLAVAGLDWPTMQTRVGDWAAANAGHPYHAEMQTFIDDGLDRKGHDLKGIRNILIGLMSSKPWEVLVGQTIASITQGGVADAPLDSLRDYLGEKVCGQILGLPAPV